MEETEITMHRGLPRCNSFLRENPMWWRFATLGRKVDVIDGCRMRLGVEAAIANDTARTGA